MRFCLLAVVLVACAEPPADTGLEECWTPWTVAEVACKGGEARLAGPDTLDAVVAVYVCEAAGDVDACALAPEVTFGHGDTNGQDSAAVSCADGQWARFGWETVP